MEEWTKNPYYSWCPECGFNAQIETKEHPHGLLWVCCGLKGCGAMGKIFNEETAAKLKGSVWFEALQVKQCEHRD